MNRMEADKVKFLTDVVRVSEGFLILTITFNMILFPNAPALNLKTKIFLRFGKKSLLFHICFIILIHNFW